MKRIKRISAADFLRSVSSGMTNQELRGKYGLSPVGLSRVFDDLRLERRKRALQILSDVRSGMAVDIVAEKNNFRRNSFGQILGAIENLGDFLCAHLADSFGGTGAERTIGDRRCVPRLQRPVLTTVVYEMTRPHRPVRILDLSGTGIGLTGITSQMNESKTFLAKIGDIAGAERLKFRCRCRWTSYLEDDGVEACAGFEFTRISDRSLGYLKTVLATEEALAATH